MTTLEWNRLLVDQLDWHWHNQVRPRLEGLTDDEYLWEPAPGGWSLRPVGQGVTEQTAGAGALRMDWAFPAADPAPVTTIAWRLGHVIVGVLAMRNASHFGAPSVSYNSYEYAETADDALAQLDEQYAVWIAGVRGLGEEGLALPCGPAEGAFAEEPLATLVLHIHREVIHHLAEVGLLRDLYPHRDTSG